MSSPTLCPNADVCGSCGWSHIAYEHQLTQKQADINASFALKELPYTVNAIHASPKIDHYRNRMDFVIDWQGSVGLREQGKWWRVIDNHPCFLADERIDELFAVCRSWAKTCGLSFFDRKAITGTLRYAVIRTTTQKESMVTIVTSAPENSEHEIRITATLHDLVKNLEDTHKDGHLTVLWAINHTPSDVSHGGEYRIISGKGFIEEEIANVRYRISPNAFFQTNPHAAPLLLDAVTRALGDLSGKTFLDLYCGTGFFSLALAGKAKKTLGIEIVPEAIDDARQNAMINHLEDKVTYLAQPTEQVDWLSYQPDIVLLDPPRAGLHPSTLETLKDPRAPQDIVYVSCNYKNLAREMALLKEFYTVTFMEAIDMFPHTPHVEVVATLKKRSS